RVMVEARIGAGDDVYRRLLEVHEGLSPGASEILNARLVLVLAGLVDDERRLEAAIAQAMEGLDPDAERPPAPAPRRC
ncbi:MAG: DUF2783 domain-containing protein, partial [Alphaproteobacteria bacterium]